MAQYYIKGSTLLAIADALRDVGGTYDPIPVSGMVSYIQTNLLSQYDFDNLISNPGTSAAKTLYPLSGTPRDISTVYCINGDTLLNIVNALRAKRNFTENITAAQIPDYIQNKMITQELLNSLINKTITYIYNSTCTTIGATALQDCTKLSYAEFTNVSTAGASAFHGCTTLNDLSLPKCTTVGTNAFKSCTNVANVTLGVTQIESADGVGQMLYKNGNLRRLVLPNLVSMYSSVCLQCYSLSYISAPKLDNLTQSAFYQCSSLTQISFPKCGATTDHGVGKQCFQGCINLSKVSLPMIKSMNAYAFSGCTALKVFYAPLLAGNSSAPFTGCTALQSVTVGYATVPNLFSGLTNLTYFSDSKATQIGSNAFNGCTSLKLENCTFGTALNCTLTSINESGFKNLAALTEIKTEHFPQTTPQIICGSYAFDACANLTKVNCDSFVSIYRQAFRNCAKLSEVTLKNAVYLGLSAFQGCTVLSYLSAPQVSSVYTGDSYFPIAGCTNLAYVNLNNLALVPGGLFRTRTALKTVIINNATTIQSSAFSGCTNLSNVQINNVASLFSDNIFIGCTALNENGIQAGQLAVINSTNQGAFRNTGFVSITSTVFPNLTSIGYNVFQSCVSLTTVNLPKVTYLGRSAFGQCTALSYLSVPGVTSVYTASNWVPTSGCTNLKFANFNGLTTVPYALFTGRTLLSVAYVQNATTINKSAFKDCSALKSVYMNAATTLNEAAFANCTVLSYVSAPALVSITTNYVFQNTGFTNVNSSLFPALTSISHYCFSSCANLSSVNLPKVTYLGRAAFGNCPKLTYISVPAVTSIYVSGANTPLEGNTNLTFANFNALATIPRYLLTNHQKLSSVVVGNATQINAYAFQSCIALSTINLPKATTIKSNAFNACTGLKTAYLSAATTIEADSFAGCTALSSIDIGTGAATKVTIAANAFRSLTALNTLVIRYTSLASLANWSTPFTNTGITSTTGTIKVPSAWVASYKAATNWSKYTAIITAI